MCVLTFHRPASKKYLNLDEPEEAILVLKPPHRTKRPVSMHMPLPSWVTGEGEDDGFSGSSQSIAVSCSLSTGLPRFWSRLRASEAATISLSRPGDKASKLFVNYVLQMHETTLDTCSVCLAGGVPSLACSTQTSTVWITYS